jgi:Type IV secretion system pilin
MRYILGIFLAILLFSGPAAFVFAHVTCSGDGGCLLVAADNAPDSGGGTTAGSPSSGGGTTAGSPSSGGGTTAGGGSNVLQNPLKGINSVTDLLKAVIDIVLVFAVPIIVFFIIYAGFMYVTAQGSPEKIKRATSAFTWAIIGGVLILGAWALIAVIQGTVNALR